MNKMIKSLLGLFVLLLILPSCRPQEDLYEEIILKVSEETLSFAKDASEKTVSITTNSSEWSFMSPQDGDWLVLTQSGSSLNVKAMINPNGAERVGTIIIFAGDKQKRVVVRQAASDVTLRVGVESVSFESEGGSKQIAFSTNGTVAVELATEADWVTISDVTGSGFVATVAENTAKVKRSVKVNLIAGSVIREVEIVQDGIMYYVLPILKMPAKVREIIQLEQQRGSVVAMLPDQNLNKNYYRVLTKSPIMQLIQYDFSSIEATRMSTAGVLCPDPTLLIDNQEFFAFMASEGFTQISEVEFTREDGNFSYYAYIEAGPNGAALEIVVMENQGTPYPTFTELPLLEQANWLAFFDKGIHGTKKRADVTAWETARGSERIELTPHHDMYKLAEGESPEILGRGYFYFTPGGKITKDSPFIDQIFEIRAEADINRIFWFDGTGNHVVTNEFKDLMARYNINYLTRLANGNVDVFYDATNERAFAVVPVYSSDETLVADYHIFRYDNNSPTSLSLAYTKDSKELLRRLKVMNEKLTPPSLR